MPWQRAADFRDPIEVDEENRLPTGFVILTGVSGAGKTTIAQAIEDAHPEISVYQGDQIGLPSEEILAGYGPID